MFAVCELEYRNPNPMPTPKQLHTFLLLTVLAIGAGILTSSANRDIDRAVMQWAKKIVFSKDECAQRRIRSAKLPINIDDAVDP